MISFSNLSGQESNSLMEIENDQRLDQQVAKDYFELKSAAKHDGINLEIISGYRSLDRQITIWNRKWEGKSPLFNSQGNPLEFNQLSDKDKLEAILTWSALPGTSRHHWGTDFDVYDPTEFRKKNISLNLVPEEYAKGGPCFTLSKWLNTHALSFGFYFPYSNYHGAVAAEPWHLSYQAIADKYQNAITLDYLDNLISIIEIKGKRAVMQNLEFIHQRFIQPYRHR